MSDDREIELLEAEWMPDHGFFWRVRSGDFDHGAFERVMKLLATLSFPEAAQLPRRTVSLLWYAPLVMHWQVGRLQERSGDANAYAKAITALTNEVERLLGVP